MPLSLQSSMALSLPTLILYYSIRFKRLCTFIGLSATIHDCFYFYLFGCSYFVYDDSHTDPTLCSTWSSSGLNTGSLPFLYLSLSSRIVPQVSWTLHFYADDTLPFYADDTQIYELLPLLLLSPMQRLRFYLKPKPLSYYLFCVKNLSVTFNRYFSPSRAVIKLNGTIRTISVDLL